MERKKLKIAILSPIAWRTPPRDYGPWELVASNIAEGLVKRGHEVTLFATKESITEGDLHAVCHTGYEEDKSINSDVWRLLHISEIFERADDFDIIHNHFDFTPLTFSKLTKTPILTTIHGFSSPEIYPIYEKYNENTHYVSISDSDRHEKLDYVDTVHNGINIDEFNYNPAGGDYLVFLGRICYEKGTYECIQIAKKSNKKLIIAGIIQEKDYFKKYIEPFIDGEQIKFIGPVNPEKRNELLGNALATLHPVMRPERFGLIMPESFACGTPVIGFDKGSIKEVINDGKTGFIVNNIDEAVEAVKKIDNINRIDCRIEAVEKFSVEKMVEGYLKVYNKILTLKDKDK